MLAFPPAHVSRSARSSSTVHDLSHSRSMRFPPFVGAKITSAASSSSASASTPRRQRTHTSRRAGPPLSAADSPTAIDSPKPAVSPSPPKPRQVRPASRAARVSTPPATPPTTPPELDIANYPCPDLLRLLAALLTQIASANDALRASTAPNPHSPESPGGSGGPSRSAAAPSSAGGSFSFHARNIPTISIESYLLRILKYCPMTNEVFLSLLVYFDRMSRASASASSDSSTGSTTPSGFAIDSYNVHRLIIAGVTVASKFFSDVFYLNSRYAKVGGLPQSELNQLELQFLLLNDFRLVIAPEEMQRYANQLLLYSVSLKPSSSPSSSSTHSPKPDFPEPRAPLPHSLPTPNPSPTSVRTSVQMPFGFQPGSHHPSSFDEVSEEGGYGTTDDEPTIRPDHSSGSSIHTDSSAATSQATTPAGSPARQARWSVGSQRSQRAPYASESLPLEEGAEGDADGEGDETDDDEIYRRGRRTPARSERPSSRGGGRSLDTHMASP